MEQHRADAGRRPAKVTVRRIAEAAHVSPATVSKALNDTGRIAPETRRMIRRIADELGYRRSAVAHAPRRTGIIAVATTDLKSSFITDLLEGVEQALGTTAYCATVLYTHEDPELEERQINRIASHGIDGLILTGSNTDARSSLRDRVTMGLPTVYAYAPSRDPGDCSVVADNVRAGRDAIARLIAYGCTRIALIGAEEHWAASTDRINGALRELGDRGLTPVTPIQFGSWEQDWGVIATERLLDAGNRIDGIYCVNDLVARGAIELLRSRGLRVPEDVAVVGHDNRSVAYATHPTIATFTNNLTGVGALAATLLVSAIYGEFRPDVTTTACPPVFGESCPVGARVAETAPDRRWIDLALR
ncbi:LacI family DNA-binding transcriptional regulator [Bifidobacterium ramosum]|nr:LacI family DNA-binding transcriptional regulator [Bifidobacterium ramosum]